MIQRKVLLFVLFITTAAIVKAEPLPVAQWIWQPGATNVNCWMRFRKQVDLNSVPAKALATIAADSKYWLWINGQLVVREGGLKRTPDPYNTYADTVNLQPFLIKGKNTIAVVVWYWGKEGHGHNSSGHGGLYFDAPIGRNPVVSDSSWLVSVHPAFDSVQTGPQPYRPLSEFNVDFDARKADGDWCAPSYNDKVWAKSATFGAPPAQPWGKLITRPIPQWKDYGLKNYVNGFTKKPIGNIMSMQLPYNAQITPYFKIKAPAGLTVSINTDKYTDGGAYNVRSSYITTDGIQEFESPGWMSGEQVWYSFPAGVEILSLQYRETGYDTDFQGSFTCDDEFYNKLWQKSLRTLYLNMRDNFMDCPTRERAMWWGDVVTESLQSYYAFSPSVYPLTRKAIAELTNWQTLEGILYSPIPGPHPPLPFGPQRELPLQSLAAISEFGFWNYYLFTGDKQTLIAAYPAVKKYLSLWSIGSDGLVKHRDGKWSWQDWGDNIDVSLLDNEWYYSALSSAKKMAVLSGHRADTAAYQTRMKSIRINFDRLFWTGSEYRSASHRGAPDDRGNAMALVTGLAGKDKWPAINGILTRQYHAGPYMEKYILEAMLMAGHGDNALLRMKNRYAPVVNNSGTTLWEGWDADFYQTSNHGWSGGPLALLVQYVAGITPLKPGFKQFTVRPMPGKLKQIETSVPTSYGLIVMKLAVVDHAVKINLKIPPGTDALIDLSGLESDGRQLYINDEPVPESSPKKSKQLTTICQNDKQIYLLHGEIQ